ncbi:ABC transporter ATP-binding protein [Serratia phage Moabite]|uniref:ABC transporter ATP-binding protein n=1 Tax=Serratia phage Moabite TaxID=2587814 RepID=A0A4Y5TPX8_9CAUD|nr:ABC transporter ATP-binding protein [Serratia phage Moabite]QDB71089.1 ABC transporter ATP-binding protein [Serratia phage Moabite]
MIDRIKLKILGRVGSGKTSVLRFIKHKHGLVSNDPNVNAISLERALGVMDEIKRGLLKEINVKIVSKSEPVSGLKNGDMVLAIEGNLSRAIKCQFMLDVIIPALTSQGIKFSIASDLSAHVDNPAVFPLDKIDVSYEELYPRN